MIRKIVDAVSNFLGDSNRPDTVRSSKTAAFLSYTAESNDPRTASSLSLKESDIGREILSAKPEEQKDIALDLIDWLTRHEIKQQELRESQTYTSYYRQDWRVRNAADDLLRKNLPFNEDEVLLLYGWSMTYEWNGWRGIPQIIKQTKDFIKREKLTSKLQRKLEMYIKLVSDSQYSDAETRQQLNKLRELAGQTGRNPLVPGEAWSDLALDQLSSLKDAKRLAWVELLNLCVASKGSVPTVKWQKASEAALKEVGWKSFKTLLLAWLPLVDKPRTRRIESWSEWSPDPNLLINDHNADILKGLVWTSVTRADKDVLRALSALAISAYRKVPGVGPRCVRVGNACVWALGEAKDSAAIGHLAVLKTRIKSNSVQKVIENALEKAAKRSDLPKDEIEEMSVPTFGLTEVGRLTNTFGEYTVHVSVKGTDEVHLQWFDPNAKALKSTPASVKKEHANELKELSQAIKDIRQMLSAQRDRIDASYVERRSWNYDIWRERYLDHPLVGTIARRLIWKFKVENDPPISCIWLDGKLVGSAGEAFGRSTDNTTVELWHPLDDSTANVLAWREFLENNSIQQPFKQAHREIYLLTDAERNTNVYSNRFAAHIVKQHQFNALCSARRWKNKLRLMVDDEYPPATKVLKSWDLRAEFWIEGIGENYGEDTNDAGTFLYLATDQVRFYQSNARENSAHAGGGGYGTAFRGAGIASEPLEIDRIPPLVFSEIMRDVDLFVGVSSVGNDPNWLDTGRDGAQRNYWYDYSFGDLSTSAQNRKQVLEKIIPRLKIASRCTFDNNFLVVAGDIRTYKIHLGSGNILMKPNDQYLCIVAKQSTFSSDKVFLPFEGDQRVAIILSKAFLLAADSKIDDPVIVRQIQKH